MMLYFFGCNDYLSAFITDDLLCRHCVVKAFTSAQHFRDETYLNCLFNDSSGVCVAQRKHMIQYICV